MRIDDYAFGRVTIDGTTYHSDLLILPDGVRPDWWRNEGHELAVADLWELTQAKRLPRILVVGTGAYGRMKVLPETKEWLKRQGIELREAPTAEACRQFNVLAGQSEDVAAALHLTC